MYDKSAYETVNGRYGVLTVFANDIGAATKSLLTYGEWAENEITFLRRFVRSGGTVLDVGAYIGTHTLAFARLVEPEGRVIAIEAQPGSFEVLRKNVEANVAAKRGYIVQIENAVASSEVGQVAIPTIDIRRENSFGSASLVSALDDRPSTAGLDEDSVQDLACVRAITIDSLDLQRCELIKIDVEGLEHLVLRGALRTLGKCSPVVYCECNNLTAGLKSMALLESAGYKVFAHVVNAFNPDNFFEVQENIFDNAREVALVGLPADHAVQLRQCSARDCELLLDIGDADDLALALLNKPQYPVEVLRRGSAAKTGGDQFLKQYNTYRLECDRLQRENGVLQNLRSEEQRAFEQVQTAHERAVTFIKQKDEVLNHLNAMLEQRSRELAELRDLLSLRDTDIARLQTSLDELKRELAELRDLLSLRDTDLARLQASLDELKRYSAEIEVVLNQRHIDVSDLRVVVGQKEQDLDKLRRLLAQRNAELSRRTADEGDLAQISTLLR